MKNKIFSIALSLTVLFSLIITSCSSDGDVSSKSDAKILLREEKPVISAENLELLKQQALREYLTLNLNEALFEPRANLQSVYDKLLPYERENLSSLNLPTILGSDYNADYFDKLNEFLAFSARIANSELFFRDSSIQSRERTLGDILLFVLENGYQATVSSCGPGYAPCVRTAERNHKIRMQQATLTAVISTAISFGAGGPGATAGWVIAMIYSGIQYDSDMQDCWESNGC